jgi:hypothetical protein
MLFLELVKNVILFVSLCESRLSKAKDKTFFYADAQGSTRSFIKVIPPRPPRDIKKQL